MGISLWQLLIVLVLVLVVGAFVLRRRPRERDVEE